MKWLKKGLIFVAEHHFDWMVSHAAIPVVESLSNDRLRIYFAARDDQGRSRPACIDVEAGDPRRILKLHGQPILPLGKLGTFDESGIMPSWIVNQDGKSFLYYIGWNRQHTVPYRLAIGLAVSENDHSSFTKYAEGPIADRSLDEPYFNTAPCVRFERGIWRMWYVSTTGWEVINDRAEPQYRVRYAESSDGVIWRKTNHVCIDYDDFTEAIARPCVYLEQATYRMFYSYRSLKDYRSQKNGSYRLGYAESSDGISWQRKDSEVGIERSASGWDSEMIEYSYVHEHRGTTYLFYNGNGFGASGFGYAVLEK